MAAIGARAPSSHPLRQQHFRRLWIGRTVSLLGDQCYLVALPWLVLQLTGSALAMGTVLMAAAVPRAVLMLVGGAVSDRISARQVMMFTAGARTVLVGAVGLLTARHLLRLDELYALAFAFGVADAFGLPAGSAYLPAIVAPEQLVAANSVSQSTAQLTTIAGPAPAGWAIRAFGMAWAFYLDAISFLFIIGALWTLPDPLAVRHGKRPPMRRSIAEGLTYVRRDVPLCALMLVAAAINFCVSGPVAVGLAVLVKLRFNSALAYGTMISAMAAGGLLGTLLAGIVKVRRRGWMMLACPAALAVGLAPLGLMTRQWQIGSLLLVIGAVAGLVNVHIAAWIQQRIEPQVRGRVMSVLMLSALGLQPLSLAVAGLLAAWSLPGLFALAGVVLLGTASAGVLVRPVREIA